MENICHNTDCLLYMKNIKNKAFDWAICDPPYGIDVGNMAYVTELKTGVKQKNGNVIIPRKSKRYDTQDWDKNTPSKEYFDEVVRISKNQIIFGVNYFDYDFIGKGRIKWDKCVADGMSFSRYEYAYCSAIDYWLELRVIWSGFQQPKSITQSHIPQGNKKLNEKRIHICQKPITLYQKIMLELGIECKSVFDRHVGSGSIRIACDTLGNSFVGCEIDKSMYAKQERRYNQFSSALRMF